MRTGKDLLVRCFAVSPGRQRISLFAALDRALVDAPSLCCDGDELCAACQADSAPWLTGGDRLLEPALCCS